MFFFSNEKFEGDRYYRNRIHGEQTDKLFLFIYIGDMNLKFKYLVHLITSGNYNMSTLNEDIRMLEWHSEWRFREFIWWEDLLYYLVPRKGFHALR